jgi:hypothetical protein
MFPQRGPCGEICSVYRANGLFIHLYLSETPVKKPSHEREGKHTVAVHGAQSGWKAYIQWGAAWFHKGIVYDIAITTPVACKPSAGYLPPWLGKTRSLLARVCLSNPLHSIPSTPVTTYQVTQATYPRDSEVWSRGWVYGRQDYDSLCRMCDCSLCYIAGSSKIVRSALGIN